MRVRVGRADRAEPTGDLRPHVTDGPGRGHHGGVGSRVATAMVILTLVTACGRTELILSGAAPGNDAAFPAVDASTDAPVDEDTASDAPGDSHTERDSETRDTRVPDSDVIDGEGGSPAACGVATCPDSCCLPDGSCALNESNLACGTGGQACVVCAPDEFCKGRCNKYQDNCGPSNCAGCCENSNICAPGDDDYACGHMGYQCQPCLSGGSTGQCVPLSAGGGICNGGTSCDAANCTGCCQGSICLVGDQEGACGSHGATCEMCPAGQACAFVMMDTGYACMAAPCDPSTCSGCCDGLVCAVGNQDVACGSGGEACVSCAASQQKCSQNACH
jgi:hypothetical protein